MAGWWPRLPDPHLKESQESLMHLLPYIVAYAAVLVFTVAVIARILMFSRMPMHLRWELYPVAHEAKKAHYGGSYLEEFEWWTKPRETSLVGELKVMIPEILFLVALRENNRKMWRQSFPFHLGLYLIIGSTLLMMAAGILTAIWPALAASPLLLLFRYAIMILGVAGLCVGLLGAFGLLGQRLTSPELEDYTARADIFNLVFFIAAFGSALLLFLLADRDFSHVSVFVRNLVSFNLTALPGAERGAVLLGVSAILLSVLLAYIPMTHMSHFVGKYFAYHAVRWNDEPNLPGGRHEATIGAMLNQPVGWSAPHIQGDGEGKTWAEVATENPNATEK
jgi:nitrate reductase gamma subunit